MSIRKLLLCSIPILLLALSALLWKFNPFAKPPQPLRPQSSTEERLALIRCLHDLYQEPPVTQSVPTIERWIREDPDADVRREAVTLRGLIAYKQENKVCPLSVAMALFDRDPDVHRAARDVACLCKEFPPTTLVAVLNAADNKDAEVRCEALEILGCAPSDDESVRAAIQRARDDENFNVRNTAHCKWFQITGDLETFVPHCLRNQAEYSNMPPLPPDSSEQASQDSGLKQLIQLGTLQVLERKGEERPEEIAALTLRYLGDRTAILRRGAAIFVGSLAEDALKARRKLNHAPQEASKKDAAESGALLDPLDSPKLIARLSELKVEAILHSLERSDGDNDVREAASAALKKWTTLQKEQP